MFSRNSHNRMKQSHNYIKLLNESDLSEEVHTHRQTRRAREREFDKCLIVDTMAQLPLIHRRTAPFAECIRNEVERRNTEKFGSHAHLSNSIRAIVEFENIHSQWLNSFWFIPISLLSCARQNRRIAFSGSVCIKHSFYSSLALLFFAPCIIGR